MYKTLQLPRLYLLLKTVFLLFDVTFKKFDQVVLLNYLILFYSYNNIGLDIGENSLYSIQKLKVTSTQAKRTQRNPMMKMFISVRNFCCMLQVLNWASPKNDDKKYLKVQPEEKNILTFNLKIINL